MAGPRTAACLDESTAQAFVERQLPSDAIAGVKDHIDGCARCRRLLAELAHATASTIGAGPRLAGPPDAGLSPGAAVGRYAILAPLGSGGMGAVYRAHDPQLNREVALKVLHPALLGSPASQARLLREAEAMARLAHPNVVAVYDSGTFDGRVFVAMELVAGTTLGGWLAEPRTWREILAVAVQIARGLAAAHAAGLVHRDFKPDNVLVTSDGRARVTDFGLARWIAEPEATTGVAASPRSELATDAGALVGTPAYMAPEQLRGAPAGPPTDQFALCVVLYEAFYGVRPFQIAELAAVAPALPPPPAGSTVPRQIARLLARGLSLAPGARHPSISALLAALADVPERAAQRRTLIAIVAGLVVLAAVAALIAPRVVRDDARAAPPPPFVADIAPILPMYDEAVDALAISPDGRWVAFASDRGDAARLRVYLESIDGGDARALSPATFAHSLSAPRWRADGQSVYAVDDQGTAWELFRDDRPMRSVASGVRTFDDCAGTVLRHDIQAPDCLSCERLVARAGDGSEREIYRSTPGFHLSNPRCDRAGRRAVFTADPWGTGERASDVWIVALAGGAPIQVTHDASDDNETPVFTPAGDSIIVSRLRRGAKTLWELPLAPGQAAVAISAGIGRQVGADIAPDGTTLLFVSDESTNALFAHHLDGRPTERLSRTLEDYSAPVPTADGRGVIVGVMRDLAPLIIEIELATRAERIIAMGSPEGLRAAGTELVYQEIEELWVRPIAGGRRRLLGPLGLPPPQFTAVGVDDQLHIAYPNERGLGAQRVDLASGVVAREDGEFQLPAPTGGWRAAVTLDPPDASAGSDALPEALLHLIPPAGSGARAPAPIREADFPVIWDPSGRAVLSRHGDDIRRITVPAGDSSTVVHAPGLVEFAVSPDGATLFTIEAVNRAHAMRIRNFGARTPRTP